MGIVKVSSKYQLVIPKKIRSKLNLKKGQEVVIIPKGRILFLIPKRPLKELRGFVKGIDKEGIREK